MFVARLFRRVRKASIGAVFDCLGAAISTQKATAPRREVLFVARAQAATMYPRACRKNIPKKRVCTCSIQVFHSDIGR